LRRYCPPFALSTSTHLSHHKNSSVPLQERELTTTKEDECLSLITELKGYFQ
jgi:hypothetical protein